MFRIAENINQLDNVSGNVGRSDMVDKKKKPSIFVLMEKNTKNELKTFQKNYKNDCITQSQSIGRLITGAYLRGCLLYTSRCV